MTESLVKDILLWCVGLNYAVLLVWSVTFILARDWMYRMHSRWFKISNEMFDAIHYSGLTVYKIGIFLFILFPLVAVCLAS